MIRDLIRGLETGRDALAWAAALEPHVQQSLRPDVGRSPRRLPAANALINAGGFAPSDAGGAAGMGMAGVGGATDEAEWWWAVSASDAPVGPASRWRECHFADALSPSLLRHLLRVEGSAAD